MLVARLGYELDVTSQSCFPLYTGENKRKGASYPHRKISLQVRWLRRETLR